MDTSTNPGPPYTASPMGDELRDSMVPVALIAILSFMFTGTLICYLVMTYSRARTIRREFTPQYQNVILIFNLLLGDFIQSVGFGLDATWLLQRRVVLGSVCNLQGTLIQTGDMLGSSFVMSIAVHTFIYVVLKRSISKLVFVVWIILIWFLSLLSGIGLPLILHAYSFDKPHYWTLAGSWCWIRVDYTAERLLTHYLFIFFDQIVCIVVYLSIYIKLVIINRRGRMDIRSSSNGKVEKAARLMIIYPLAYIFCTLPLASIRVHTMLGGNPSLKTGAVVGAMFASSGMVNSLLYGITRNLGRTKKTTRQPKAYMRPHGNLTEHELERRNAQPYKVTATVVSATTNDSKDKGKDRNEHNFDLPVNDREGKRPPAVVGPIQVQSETIMRTESLPVWSCNNGASSTYHEGRDTTQLLEQDQGYSMLEIDTKYNA